MTEKDVITELLARQTESEKRADEHGAAIVVIARAVGVDEQHLPPSLVRRSAPPPATSATTAPQRPPLPAAKQYTRWAVGFAAIELVRELVSLITYLLHH